MTLAPLEEHELSHIRIDELKFDQSNPNELTAEQMEALRKSMKKFGYLTPIIVDQNNMIADGEHRALIYKEFGFSEIPCFKIKLKDDIERRMLRQVMNKLHGEHDRQRDANELLQIFESKQLDELAQLIAQPREGLESILTKYHNIHFQHDEDYFDVNKTLEELVPVTKLGDIWQLGEHRIICADCTDKRSLDKLFAGKSPDIILTDPPYSSGGFQEAGKRVGSIGTRQHATINNDALSTRGYIGLIKNTISGINADVVYVFTDWRMWGWLSETVETSGFPVRNMIVWDKMQMGMGFPWRTQHELILFAKRTAGKMLDGKRGNVLQSKRTGNINHPVEKPVDLLSQLLDNTEGRLVYDPFIGSGSTLIACEESHKICYGCDIDPRYCDVIVKRWEQYTGKKAQKCN